MTDNPTGSTPEPKPDLSKPPLERPGTVIGDVLPDTTSDEREPGADRAGWDDDRDDWLRNEVPPHH